MVARRNASTLVLLEQNFLNTSNEKFFLLGLIPLLIMFSPVSRAANVEPIFVKNSLPFMEGLGLPAPKKSAINDAGVWSVRALGSVQSFANVESNGVESFTLDGEVHKLGAAIEWGFAPRWQASVILEGISNTAGSLDRLIDRWHETFGLPEGDRPFLGEDQLLFQFNSGLDDGANELSESTSGFADVEIGVSYQWLNTKRLNIAAHLAANVPTGNANDLTGSEDLDLSLSLAASSKRGLGFNWHANLGVLAIGDDQVFGLNTESVTWFSSAGLHWQPSERWGWIAQLDGRGAVLQSDFQELSDAAFQVAIGSKYSWGVDAVARNSLQIYFTEDISVNRAADFGVGVNFSFSL